MAAILRMSKSGRSYFFTRLNRQIYWLRGRQGRFVRYGLHWCPLHGPEELEALILKVPDRDSYQSVLDLRLPFIKTWEPSLGFYRAALYY